MGPSRRKARPMKLSSENIFISLGHDNQEAESLSDTKNYEIGRPNKVGKGTEKCRKSASTVSKIEGEEESEEWDQKNIIVADPVCLTPSKLPAEDENILNAAAAISIPEGNEELNAEQISQLSQLFRKKRIALGYAQEEVSDIISGMIGVPFSRGFICKFEYNLLGLGSMRALAPTIQKWLNSIKDQEIAVKMCDVISETAVLSKSRRRGFDLQPFEIEILEEAFEEDPGPNRDAMDYLSTTLNRPKYIIPLWFRARRNIARKLRDVAQKGNINVDKVAKNDSKASSSKRSELDNKGNVSKKGKKQKARSTTGHHSFSALDLNALQKNVVPKFAE